MDLLIGRDNMDILNYKDYQGTAELDMARGVCRGKILFINDVVTYESATPATLQNEFEAAVDDYVATCATLGREPQKSLKGQFNVRIPPALHKAATLRALADGVSMNDVIVRALDSYINASVAVNHVENKNYYISNGEFVNALASAGNSPSVYSVYGSGTTSGVTGQVVAMKPLIGEANVSPRH